MKKAMPILITIVLTTLIVLFLMNFFTAEKRIEKKLNHLYEIKDAQYPRSISVLLGPPFLAGNDIKTLTNGDEIFTAMLKGIHSAKKTITFETFIYWNDS